MNNGQISSETTHQLVSPHHDVPSKFLTYNHSRLGPQPSYLGFLHEAFVSTSQDHAFVIAQSENLSKSSDSLTSELDLPLSPSLSTKDPITDRTSHLSTTTKKKGGKKYKPVAVKVRPIVGELPRKFRIIHKIIGDPLEHLPTLLPKPPKFVPCGWYTAERRDIIDWNNAGFLLSEEQKLLHHFMMLHQDGFAWNDTERGHFREDFFPLIDMPVVPHKPWVLHNIPIPPGIYDDVCEAICWKLQAGTFEPSNSSYRTQWFCVVKKDGKALRPVLSLEPLNHVTIQHSRVPPFTEQLAEHFASCACGSMLDLYISYDKRALAESSRDYTTFQSLFGALRLTTLPIGWTNSVPIFHDDVTFILQAEIPYVTIPYIDDVPIRGPASRYILPSGEPETIPENPGIRRFIWEHFQDLNQVVQRMKYSGGTFSGVKIYLASAEITVLGHCCTIDGWLLDQSRIEKIINWGPCRDLSDVRVFLGTIGVCRLFIRNFTHRAHHLVKLTRKGAEWEFGQKQLDTMNDLKDVLLKSPALWLIDYKSEAPVILLVDTSYIAIGYLLSQCDLKNPRLRYYAKFGSITLNDRESRFSQPKLELYGLYQTLRVLKLLLIGIRTLVIEVDASFGEVWFGSVWGTFCQTGNQTVRFFSDFQKPKPKLHQTVWCGFKWFQTQFKPKPFKKKFICNNLFTLHNFVVYLLQIYSIYIKLHIDGCPEEKR